MGTRDRDQQTEQERQQLEQELAEQQRTSSPREQQSVGDDELTRNPAIINK